MHSNVVYFKNLNEHTTKILIMKITYALWSQIELENQTNITLKTA